MSNEFTKEQIEKALACQTVEELLVAAKSEGIEISQEEAEAFMAEKEDRELDEETLMQVAGGKKDSRCLFIGY